MNLTAILYFLQILFLVCLSSVFEADFICKYQFSSGCMEHWKMQKYTVFSDLLYKYSWYIGKIMYN